MHRLLNVLVVLATLGTALMVFDSVRAFGASLLTSAGILGLVAGIAAQRTLQNVFAGLQLAITQPIALGDVVEVENVVGTVEEITFSFVSVRLRDLRRLILPVTYFLERPFTNWTRTSAESLTSFSLVLSLGDSLPAIRKQVDEILRANPLWNGGEREVMISELGESSMVVRITLGAANPEIAFQLKSQVRDRIFWIILINSGKAHFLARLPIQNPQWSCQKQKIHRTWSRRQRRRPRKAAQAKQTGENDSDEILTDHCLSSWACSS